MDSVSNYITVGKRWCIHAAHFDLVMATYSRRGCYVVVVGVMVVVKEHRGKSD